MAYPLLLHFPMGNSKTQVLGTVTRSIPNSITVCQREITGSSTNFIWFASIDNGIKSWPTLCHCDDEGVDNKTIWKQGKFLPLYLLLKGISIVWLYHIGLKSFKNYFKNQHFMKFLWREQLNIYKHKASEGGNKSFQRNCTFFIL